MIRAVVTGAMGRMGLRLVQMIHEAEGITLAGALEKPDHLRIGSDAGEAAGIGEIGVPFSSEIEPLLDECDVVIDFTFPEVSLKNVQAASKAGVSTVIGTTGFSGQEIETIRDCSRKAPNLLAPNMSLGINLLLKILPEAARALGEDFDIEIIEAHHHFKKDAPSGTALRLAEVIAEALERDPASSFVYGREGDVGVRKREEIGIHVVRGGDIVGDHTVMFCGAGERIEFVHRASSRDTFVKGAIHAAQWIVRQKPGLYSMLDVLGL